MSEQATLTLPRYGTRLPSSFYAGRSGHRSEAGTNSSAPDFESWLFSEARTELGAFPDWPYLREYARALQAGRDIICLKRRQILISWVTAAYWHFEASRKPYHHGAVTSAGKVSSAKQGRRIVTVARHDGYDVSGVDLIKYPSGSEISLLPSTQHAGVGDSLPLGLHADELAFHPYAEENLATIQPAVSNSGGQTIISSTSNPEMGAAGAFPKIWEATPAGPGKLFYGRYVRPDQGPDSDFWIKERAKPVNAGANFDAFYPITPEDAFTARAGLVYELDRAKTIREARTSWFECAWRVVGIDLGGGDGDPTAIVPLGVTRSTSILRPESPGIESIATLQVEAHQYGEYVAKRMGFGDIVEVLKRLGGPSQLDIVAVAETGGETVTTGLKALGYNAVVHKAARSDIDTYCRWWYDSGLCTIGPECEISIREFGVYRWKYQRNQLGEKYETSTPDWTHGDCFDARRAGLMETWRGLPNLGIPRGQPQRVRVDIGGKW